MTLEWNTPGLQYHPIRGLKVAPIFDLLRVSKGRCLGNEERGGRQWLPLFNTPVNTPDRISDNIPLLNTRPREASRGCLKIVMFYY